SCANRAQESMESSPQQTRLHSECQNTKARSKHDAPPVSGVMNDFLFQPTKPAKTPMPIPNSTSQSGSGTGLSTDARPSNLGKAFEVRERVIGKGSTSEILGT